MVVQTQLLPAQKRLSRPLGDKLLVFVLIVHISFSHLKQATEGAKHHLIQVKLGFWESQNLPMTIQV